MLKLRPYQTDALEKLKSRLKEVDHPLLVNASVGAGKSFIIAELLLIIERAGWRALCLTMNSTLISQNVEAYRNQGGSAGVYCAALKQKDTDNNIIFGSPISILKGIAKGKGISKVPFNLIVIDECHNINVADPKTAYIRIFNWYSSLGQKIRFVGLTGTPYRGKGHSIVGEGQFFKEEVCRINAEWLIEKGYLAEPKWGSPREKRKYDFEKIKVNQMGQFDSKDLKAAVNNKPKLTGLIMEEVEDVVNERNGAFIFATSLDHCKECAKWLPPHRTAIITGDTPHETRKELLSKARNGEIKYLINMNVLCTGVDVPNFDTVVFVRPTESLVLYMQCIGRGLRLYDGKKDCLILDYAGNLDRHGDVDNPILNIAVRNKDPKDNDYCIPCYKCNTFNKLTARRCIGTHNDKRCEHFFTFKECKNCDVINDITARNCRNCNHQLIDPNKKLNEGSSVVRKEELRVISASYWLGGYGKSTFYARYLVTFMHKKAYVNEHFFLNSQRARNYFYAKFVKEQFEEPSQAWNYLGNSKYLEKIIIEKKILTPSSVVVSKKGKEDVKIVKKVFL